MRRLAVLGMVVAAVLMVAGVSAQSKPDFSGKWTLVPDPNAPAGGGGGGGRAGGGGGGRGGFGGGRGGGVSGQELTITQTAAALKVERVQGGNPITLTYMLDGSDSKNTMPGRQGGAGTEVVSKAKWEGNSIAISTSQSMQMGDQSMTIESKQVISMGADGTMVVDTTTSGMGGGDGVTTKATYKKG